MSIFFCEFHIIAARHTSFGRHCLKRPPDAMNLGYIRGELHKTAGKKTCNLHNFPALLVDTYGQLIPLLVTTIIGTCSVFGKTGCVFAVGTK